MSAAHPTPPSDAGTSERETGTPREAMHLCSTCGTHLVYDPALRPCPEGIVGCLVAHMGPAYCPKCSPPAAPAAEGPRACTCQHHGRHVESCPRADLSRPISPARLLFAALPGAEAGTPEGTSALCPDCGHALASHRWSGTLRFTMCDDCVDAPDICHRSPVNPPVAALPVGPEDAAERLLDLIGQYGLARQVGDDRDMAEAYRLVHEAVAARTSEVRALRDKAAAYDRINTPEIADFLSAVENEALHQRERWGVDADGGKEASDWFWLVGYLAGKALHDVKGKRLHHLITTAAALLNWHGQETGNYARMRPGIDAARLASPSPTGAPNDAR